MKYLKHTYAGVGYFFYFLLSICLFSASFYLVYQATRNLWKLALELPGPMNVPLFMESVIFATLSLAIFDLAKATVEEDLIRDTDYLKHSEIRRGLTRFLTAVTVAISIEVLMLIFKFSLDQPENLLYAALLMFGLALLITSLGIYSMLGVRAETKKDKME